MRKILSCSILLLIFQFGFGQREFEPGYFIDNSGTKVECLIQNEKWLFSPEEVFYKLNGSSETKSFTVANCVEFRIGNEGKFRRVEADFPITQSKLKKKELSPEPELVHRTAFVQNIVKGKASLFWYVNNDGIVYLYSKDNGEIHPLLYKKYVLENLKIKENNIFKSQLVKDFECGNQLIVQETKYTRKSIIKYFEYLNECLGDTNFTVYERTAKQKANFPITLKLWAGLQQNSYETENQNPPMTFSFEDETVSRFGVELEAFFPYFGYKKASIFLSGHYSKVGNSFSFPPTEVSERSYEADYTIIEVSFGGRYYFGVTEKSSIFIDAALAASIYSDSSLNETTLNTISGTSTTEVVGNGRDDRLGGSLGLGYSYNKRVYLRAGILANQNVLDDRSIFFKDKLSRINVSLGYSLW